MINKKFQLFQCCIPVKGIKRGSVIDLQRRLVFTLPNQIIDYVSEYSGKSIYNLFYDFKANKTILKKYIRFFYDSELFILSENLDGFSPLETVYKRPLLVDIISMEIEDIKIYNQSFFQNELDYLGIRSLKLIFKKNALDNIDKILKWLENSKIQSIVLFMEYENNIEEKLNILRAEHARLMQVVFYNCSKNYGAVYSQESFYFYDILPLDKIFYKGVQKIDDFFININSYLEALHYNLNFNRTIYIDQYGNVKRHILDDKMFGNIGDKKMDAIILENESISEFWKISKDRIAVCKDCEFRYICTDGRVPVKLASEDFFYTHLTKCSYDPYKNIWNEYENLKEPDIQLIT
ncbi:grasp-with-spasm system SPASM domain peptide maturase [Flavobacterium sp. UW10123]|uniref:grasp-with-spasm system SPASM domain peptide maturase n=1 Tax=Flavobacterium sp. UW10123 TaxID=3230800 RepID=UPI003396C768